MSSFLHQLTLSMTKIVAQAASQPVSSSMNEEEIIEKIRKRVSQQDNNKIIETQKSQVTFIVTHICTCIYMHSKLLYN